MIPASVLALADASAAGFGILFDTAVKGSVLVALAAIAAWLLRDRSAAARHAAWTAAVIGHLALPVLTLVAPAWRIPLLPTPGWLSARAGADLSSISQPQSVSASAVTPTSTAPAGDRSAITTTGGPQASDEVPSGTPPTASAPQRFTIDFKLPTVAIVALLWLIGTVLVFTRLAVGTVKVSRLAKQGERVDDGEWLSLTQRIANRLGITRPLTLLRGDRLAIPVTWGVVYPAVLLPPDADTWAEERRRFVLVHEMAHVKRFDALTQLAAQITIAIFWFDPLLWIAAHRMRVEREHACDDYVLRDGTKPSLYAGDLLEMVQSIGLPSHERSAPAFAALAMARRSEFEGRMLSILDPRLDRHTLGRGSAVATGAIVALLVLPLAALRPFTSPRSESVKRPEAASIATSPRVAKATVNAAKPADAAVVYTCDTQPPGRGNVLTHVHVHDDDDDDGARVLNYMTTSETKCEEASVIGLARFSRDERQIVSLPAGAIAAFRERTLTHDRTVTVSRAPDGSLSYIATMDGRAVDYSPGARTWLSQLLPRALREMAVDVKPRVSRLRAQGGVPAVLSMIRELKSSASRRAHYEALISSGLTTTERDAVVKQAMVDLGSSSADLAAVLRRAGVRNRRSSAVPANRASNVLMSIDPSLLRQSLAQITSDGDRVSLLSQYVPTDDPAMLKLVLDGVEQITSSGSKLTVLVVAAPRVLRLKDDLLHKAFFRAVAGMASSGDQRSILIAALPYGHADETITIAALKQAADLSSDGDKTSVLVTAAKQRLLKSDAVMKAYLNTARTISSSSDMRSAMEAVLTYPNRD